MGIEEMVLERVKKQGYTEGRDEREYEVVKNLIVKTDFSDEHIADIVGVTIDLVKKVRSEIKA